jgi:hypothetical protein
VSESHELSLDQVLDKIGLTGWVALAYRCTRGLWPPSLSEQVYQHLVDARLVDVSETGSRGVPNDAGHAMATRLQAHREELAQVYETYGGSPQMADLVLGRPAPVDPNGPSPPESVGPFEAFAEDSGFDDENVDDPAKWSKSLRDLAKNPTALRTASSEMATLMGFLKKVMEAVGKLPPILDCHYRGELTAIGKDLARDLELGEVTEDQVMQALLMFLQYRGDDDDDPDPAPAPLPEDGEKVVV